MDFDELFERRSLVGQPIAVIVRPSAEHENDLASLVRNWSDLLERVPPFGMHSLTLLVSRFPNDPPPARNKLGRLRWEVSEDPAGGPALTGAMRKIFQPIVLWADGNVVPSRDELRELLERIEHADLVTLTRPATWSSLWARPMEKLALASLGIAFSDPLSPIKMFRREAFAGIDLELSGSWTHLELAAKGTYLIRLVDEAPAESSPPRPTWLTSLVPLPAGIGSFVWDPKLREVPFDRYPSVQVITLAPAALHGRDARSLPSIAPRAHGIRPSYREANFGPRVS